MSWKESQGREFAPIVQLEDGETIVVAVVEMREKTGPFESPMIDFVTLNGVTFSLNGHTILYDKLKREFSEEFPIVMISRSGMVGRAKNYTVHVWKSTLESLESSEDLPAICRSTEQLIGDKIATLPPRD